MTEEGIAERNHALVRDMTRKLVHQYTARGVAPVDTAIGVLYGAMDTAMAVHAGDLHGAIEWMRTMLDMLERQGLADRTMAN